MGEWGSITHLLARIRDDESAARDILFERIYEELKAMATRRVAQERRLPIHEGGATDLVHDAFAKLSADDHENRRHLFFAYARAMQQELITKARREFAAKRRGDRKHVSIGEFQASTEAPLIKLLSVNEMMTKLESEFPRVAQVVRLKIFGGLRNAEIAEVMGLDERTVRRDWKLARDTLRDWAT
ncbi:MAG: ECF-type sigma factor [Planctomycetota bacterium]